jgi:phage terminase large subunit-like protein
VRDGPLDDILSTSNAILRQGNPDGGLLPFICRLDSKDEINNPANWPKANPSLLYLPDLEAEMHKEYARWQNGNLPAFMTKRMNLPDQSAEIWVADYDNIKATNRPLPDTKGWDCVIGIDFAMLNDMASANAHFRRGEERIDINHSWICGQSKDIPRIKAPIREWGEKNYLTFVDEVEIHPHFIIDWILKIAQTSHIKRIAIDNFRYALLAKYLTEIGFDAKENKNLRLIRPSDIMRIVPVIDSVFTNNNFIWGDNPVLRWAANNTKKVRSGRAEGTDTGNYYYAKIEGKSRKTDPFMALVASMVIEDTIEQRPTGGSLPLIYF